MKQLLVLCATILMLSACSPKEESAKEESPAPIAAPSIPVGDEVVSFDVNTLSKGCNVDSQVICAINNAVKCTINPQFAECAANKRNMPNFIFMEDESLKRPTSLSYKITKIKPINAEMVEVYTQSTCNGNWFGLCNGNIIYVMSLKLDGQWMVKDIYAIEG